MTEMIEDIVQRHRDEAGFLWSLRHRAVGEPHYVPKDLHKLDDRLHAHIDGLRVAGEVGRSLSIEPVTVEDRGRLFAPMALALEARDSRRIDRLFELTAAVPAFQQVLISAFGWTSARLLQGTAKELLESASSLRRRLGIACCAMHRVDPGKALDAAIRDADLALRARGVRTAGEIGRLDMLPACQFSLQENDSTLRFWAAWSAVLLGDRRNALDALKAFGSVPGPYRDRALQLALRALEPQHALAFLQTLAGNPKSRRVLVQGAGIAGDPLYIPWLIKQMADLELSRLAGESVSTITGLDLAYLDLERKPPENFESGPKDDPSDENVEIDPDDGLPWPDPSKIQEWWDANSNRFQQGVRCFMGAPPTREHCIKVLKEGFQRQRIAAALYLSLLQPGIPLFEWRAPAWRQQRWLERMV